MKAVFIHLSDIHFGQEPSGGDVVINADARDRLIDAAAQVMQDVGKELAGIIVTATSRTRPNRRSTLMQGDGSTASPSG